MGAWQAIRWLKSFFSALKQVFPSFTITNGKKRRMHKKTRKKCIKRGLLLVKLLAYSVILTSGNKIDLRALTLVGPTGTSPVLDPLAVQHLDN